MIPSKTRPGKFDIRLNEDGSLDEVVAAVPDFVHLEQMDSDSWWLRLDMPDGKAVIVNFWTGNGSQQGARIHARAETE